MIQNNHNFCYSIKDIDYKIARSTEDKTRVCETVYKSYLKQGYIDKDNQSTNLFSYSWLPGSRSFLASHNGKIISTATVIPDSKFGLPMDMLFKEELDTLRNKKICEVSMLAGDTENLPEIRSLGSNIEKRQLVFHLFEHIFQYVKGTLDCDYICVAINPKHEGAYRSLLFQELGGLKSHAKLNHAPALAKFLDVKNSGGINKKNPPDIRNKLDNSDDIIHNLK